METHFPRERASETRYGFVGEGKAVWPDEVGLEKGPVIFYPGIEGSSHDGD